MCQGEEISRQERKAVSSWSPEEKASLFVLNARDKRAEFLQVLSPAASCHGALASGDVMTEPWWVVYHLSPECRARSLNCFNVFRLSARCQSSQPTLAILWIPFVLSSILSPSCLASLSPCPLIMSWKQYNHKIQRLCQTDSHCIESLVGSSKIPEPYLFLQHFKFEALMYCDRSESVLGGSPWRFLILISFMFWNKL